MISHYKQVFSNHGFSKLCRERLAGKSLGKKGKKGKKARKAKKEKKEKMLLLLQKYVFPHFYHIGETGPPFLGWNLECPSKFSANNLIH